MQSSISPPEIEYPDDDGLPMSDNTLQFRWIVTLQTNLDGMYKDDPAVFVAGNLLWYPVLGQPTIRRTPDAMVAFGRSKRYRGSYKQWEEEGVAPQVVFEVQSPGNTQAEIDDKLEFYDRHGVEEYYHFDPHSMTLVGYVRSGEHLQPVPQMHGWVSPRLGIRFDLSELELVIYRPNGERFLTPVEREREQEEVLLRTKEIEQAKDEAERKAALLAEKLRSLGIDPGV